MEVREKSKFLENWNKDFLFTLMNYKLKYTIQYNKFVHTYVAVTFNLSEHCLNGISVSRLFRIPRLRLRPLFSPHFCLQII